MSEFYPQIKGVHIGSLIVSGSLFLGRRSVVLAGRDELAVCAQLRCLSYGIDTALLSAGLMLLSIVPTVFYANDWLPIKLVLVVIDIGVASLVLKRGITSPCARFLWSPRWPCISSSLASLAVITPWDGCIRSSLNACFEVRPSSEVRFDFSTAKLSARSTAGSPDISVGLIK